MNRRMKCAEGWGVFEVDDGCVHVAPINDDRRHIMSVGCWCLPVDDELPVVIHNSMDGREAYERGERKPN